MNTASIVFVCYILAAITVLGMPLMIHSGVMAVKKHTGRNQSLTMLVALILYLMFTMILVCLGYFMLYLRFIR